MYSSYFILTLQDLIFTSKLECLSSFKMTMFEVTNYIPLPGGNFPICIKGKIRSVSHILEFGDICTFNDNRYYFFLMRKNKLL